MIKNTCTGQKIVKMTVLQAYNNGTLARLLEKHRLQNLCVFPVSENPHSGLCRLEILDTQYDRLNAIYLELGLGDLSQYMTLYLRDILRYTHTFSTRVGCNVLDLDLFGGDADGSVLGAFERAGLIID